MLPKSVSPTLLPPTYPTETGGFNLVSKKYNFFIHFTITPNKKKKKGIQKSEQWCTDTKTATVKRSLDIL